MVGRVMKNNCNGRKCSNGKWNDKNRSEEEWNVRKGSKE